MQDLRFGGNVIFKVCLKEIIEWDSLQVHVDIVIYFLNGASYHFGCVLYKWCCNAVIPISM